MGLLGGNLYLAYAVLEPTAAGPSRQVITAPAAPQFRVPVQVEVLNGCGKTGISEETRRYLRRQGFDVVSIDNAAHFEFPETVVLDRLGEDAISEEARAVAAALGTTHVILQRNDDRMVDVTVIIGRDYDRLPFYEDL